jgi:GWxTD domain-containing protein
VSNYLNLYNPGKTYLHPEFTVFHDSETQSLLFFRLLASEAIFNQANPQVKNQARMRVSYTLYSSFVNGEIAARDTQSFFIDKETIDEQITGSLVLPTEPGRTYLLDITIEDAIRQTSYRDFILVDRFSEEPQQNYMVLNFPGNKPGFERYFYPGETFRIIRKGVKTDQIYISVFPPRNVLPLPPFSTEDQPDLAPIPDSTFTGLWSEQALFRLGGEGIYVFHFQKERVKGFCLTQFGEQYPQIRKPEDMLPPLQYITTREEYIKLVSLADLKKAVDDFWLERGKSFSNSRDLIRVYYNRVTFANLYFPSSRQGWKTDRGMIYVIMGPPDRVEKTETREIWLYESVETSQTYRFEFNLSDDFWTGYDYVLKRTEDHRVPWNMAIDSWRRGKIFSM